VLFRSAFGSRPNASSASQAVAAATPDPQLVMSITDTGVLTGNLELYTLTLEGQGQKTQLTLTQSGGNLSDEEYKRAKAGTESFMDTMEGKVLPMLKARHDAM